MAFTKGMDRAALEVPFELLCELDRLKRCIEYYFPGPEFRGMRTFTGVVLSQPLF